ncbi:tyrosine-type recombinase/integrase [Asticcacaulis taihuensis]|uniref:Integrase n=1 Tax=Asticcacaulis taihuensis TaxID=260084 RepID=A0A1G4SS62_9CAUL|nr:integrase arm-type DNA-binding domain-containing protein [Asticcacaulis taihuensis]SCW71129.1 Integrase [Asticcacaulis taihuensis]
MALSDTTLRNAKPRQTQYKLHDDGGLFVIVRPSGGKLWRFKYRFAGKEQQLSFGTYPDVGLKAARTRHDEARALLAEGIDPGAERKRKAIAAEIAASNTFGAIAAEFVDKRQRDGMAEATMIKLRWFASLLEKDMGTRPVSDIEPVELLNAIKKIERAGNNETAKRVRAFAARVFRYAVITGRCRFNPAADLGEALVAPKVKHHAALIEPEDVGGLLRAIEGYKGHGLSPLALKLAPHVFVRPGELRHAEWSEFDLDKAVWRIPAEKMKMREDHAVPLSNQALEILREAKAYPLKSKYVFPSVSSGLKPMSENTLNVALRRLGYSSDEMTSHGFRSTASTLLNESGKWSSDAIERALAHKGGDNVRAIYHRGRHWEERVRMAQWWSDYLDQLKSGAKVLPFKGGKIA